jgi:HD superfamily phosphohydrolase
MSHPLTPDLPESLGILSAELQNVFEEELQAYTRSVRARGIPGGFKLFNDPIWFTIRIESWELVIVDSPVVQRLRDIKQLGLAGLVYPAAGYSRFEHTIGALYQTQRVIESIIRNAKAQNAQLLRAIESPISRSDEIQLRLAAILHDVGHCFLSHVSERSLNRLQITEKISMETARADARSHFACVRKPAVGEILSALLILLPEFQEVLEAAKIPYWQDRESELADRIARLVIKGRLYDRPFMNELISGTIDSDKLDYMARDCYMAGLAMPIDTERLIENLCVVNVPADQLPEYRDSANLSDKQTVQVFAIQHGGAKVFEDLVLSRVLLYDKLYNHQKVRAMEGAVVNALEILQAHHPAFRMLSTYVRLSDSEFLACRWPGIEKAKADIDKAVKIIELINQRNFVRAFAFGSELISFPAGESEEVQRAIRHSWRQLAKVTGRDWSQSSSEFRTAVRERAQLFLRTMGQPSIADDLDDASIVIDLPDVQGIAKRTTPEDYRALRERIRPICQRTLRRQVLPYVSYTNRHALVQEFIPNDDEKKLYALVSEYLQSQRLYALPASQRQLMTLILRKLLASSSYAISDTLLGLANKLDAIERQQAALDAPPENLADNFETLPEIEDEWLDDDTDEDAERVQPVQALSPEQREELRQEKERLKQFHELAKSIRQNSKGEVLLTALRKGFEASKRAQEEHRNGPLQQKAIIFTESRRTQEYLLKLLESSEFAGKIVLFNGTNSDPKSAEIYRNWLERNKGTDRITGSPTADKRSAIVEHFRDEASIMVATEAAAEGINLQFCNLVVNFDMPWNPQRIEQRIGRCHRYGQKYDVVVVNFLNRDNAADVRVYQLLDQKFRLFDGVFGASDEVLGAVQSGVDFEKRIVSIYQQCRTPEQISFEFDKLQQELESEVAEARTIAQEQLLNNFDQEVIEKVRVEAGNSRSRFEELLWKTTLFYLQPYAKFDGTGYSFVLERNPFPEESIHPGPYRMGRSVEDANTYRVGHQLAQRVLEKCVALDTPPVEIRFNLTKSGKRLSILEPHVGKSGWLVCSKLSVESFESEDHILLAGVRDDGQLLDVKPETRTFISAFLQGFTGAGLFQKLEIPSAPTRLFEPEPGEEDEDRKECYKLLLNIIKERREHPSSR